MKGQGGVSWRGVEGVGIQGASKSLLPGPLPSLTTPSPSSPSPLSALP